MKDTFLIRMMITTQCEYDCTDVTPTGFNRYTIHVSTKMSPRWGFIFVRFVFLQRCRPVEAKVSLLPTK